ncbi:MAG: GNAT family N-acetyltransferase [Chloroflexota bacterium]
MKVITQKITTESLITAIEENIFSLISQMKKWPQAAVHDFPEVMWAITDIPSPLINIVLRARLKPDQTDETIQTILADAKNRNVPIMWWTGPATEPVDLEARLVKHGFINAGQSDGMAVELSNIKEDIPTPGGLTVELAESKESIKQWCKVFGAVFELSDFVTDAYYDFINYIDSDKVLSYLGKVDNEPVAISQLAFGAGVAGIYSVATLPEARRQGIGAFMTSIPLLEAKKQGYKIGILHASEMGIGVYRGVGFQEYCKIGLHIWSPKET